MIENEYDDICLKLKSYNIFKCKYLYCDTSDYLADAILYNNGIRYMKFNENYSHPNFREYVVVICTFYRWNEKKFLKSMKELNNKILIVANNKNRFNEFCNYLFNNMLSIIQENRKED